MRWLDQLRGSPALPVVDESEGFSLAYQPIFDLYSPTLAGTEVLLRWNREGQGALPASAFIREYAESRRSSELSSWIFPQVAKTVQRWRERGLRPPRAFVNVGPSEIANGTFAKIVGEALDSTGLDGDFLGLEVHSSALDAKGGWPEHARSLRERGVRVAVEEFGPDLLWLKDASRLGVSFVKVDVARAASERFGGQAQSAVDAAHHVGLTVCGTRVETHEHVSMLTSLRCDLAQGFSFAGPLNATEFEELLVDAASWE